jgi:glycosyltransferase involved in cell wall biosynthesis
MMTARGAQRVILSTTERISCALASRVLAVSHSLRDVAIAEHLCRRDKIQVLAGGSGNGVDADRFAREHVGPDAREALRTELGIPADARVVGFVGRLVKDKGISELATAFRALRAQSPNVHLIVAGPFEERDPVPPETRLWLKQEPHVHLLGRVDDTPKLYAAMDVLALPTYREGFPNVPLEAAAMRVPVVATRVAGCVDAVVDGVTGSLVPARDAESLEKALRRYLDDSTLCEAHGANGRARVELSFRRERIWEALAGVYDELMAS